MPLRRSTDTLRLHSQAPEVHANEAFVILLRENNELRRTAVNIALQNAALREQLRNESVSDARGSGSLQ
jgi:hypothetical protein